MIVGFSVCVPTWRASSLRHNLTEKVVCKCSFSDIIFILIQYQLPVDSAAVNHQLSVCCQYIQSSEVGAEAVEDTGGHRKPRVTQDIVDWNHDAHHGKSRNYIRRVGSEICQIPAACAIA